MNSPAAFELLLLGPPSVERPGGSPLSGRVTQRHRVALLALLAAAPDGRLSRDKLIAYLWPESGPERGRNLLNVATYVLRSALGEAALLSSGDDLRLNAALVRPDIAEFSAALARQDYARAVVLYRGPFLDGFFLSDASEFEHWVDAERERLAGEYRQALEALAQTAEATRDFTQAVEFWKRRAAHDPYDSRVALRLMQALEASGNRAGALQHGAMHQRRLQEEFAIAAAPEITTYAEQLRNAATPSAGWNPPPPARSPENPRQASVPSGRARWHRGAPLAALTAVILLVAALWRGWPGGVRPAGSIVVLPFVNLSTDADNEYFSDGLTEELIAALSAVQGLKVISRTSAMHYKRTEQPLRQIARELNVTHVLEGSVRESAGRIRISTQLIDARSDQHLWVRNYDSDLRDVFQVQEQIAQEVVSALEVKLGERSRTPLVRQGTRDPEAHELYQRGRYLWSTRTREGHERAIAYYRRAIARDSAYADAYAGLANAYVTAYQLHLSALPEADVYARMKAAAERALALDSTSAEAHVSFALSLQWQGNWPGARRELGRALQLNPGNAIARSWDAMILSGFGRVREALAESRQAYELDPFAVVVSSNQARLLYLARDTDRAIEQFRRSLEIGPTHAWSYEGLAHAYALEGKLDEAARTLQDGIERGLEGPDFEADVAYIQALRGDTGAARATLERAKVRPFEPYNIALVYVALRQADSAFAWLERSSWQWPHRAVISDPALDPVRPDPRFAQLAQRIEHRLAIR